MRANEGAGANMLHRFSALLNDLDQGIVIGLQGDSKLICPNDSYMNHIYESGFRDCCCPQVCTPQALSKKVLKG